MLVANVLVSAQCSKSGLFTEIAMERFHRLMRAPKPWLTEDYTNVILTSDDAQRTYAALQANILNPPSANSPEIWPWGHWEEKADGMLDYRDAADETGERAFDQTGYALAQLLGKFMKERGAAAEPNTLLVTNPDVATLIAVGIRRKYVRRLTVCDGFRVHLDDDRLFYMEQEFRLP